MRKYDQVREDMLKALSALNWNDVVVYATELIQQHHEKSAFVWTNRGVGLQSMGFYVDAVLNYDKALEAEPNSAIALTNKGAAYWDMSNAEEALKWLDKALAIEDIAQAHMTMGNIFKYQGKLTQAIKSYRKSVAAQPDYADGHMVLGMALLKDGQLQEGWHEYEWRWKSGQLPPRKLKCPKWTGQDLTGKNILVYGEQGLGDIVQFARYAPLLANQFPRCKVIIEGRPPVKRLLETMPEVYAVINAGERVPEIDYAISMIDLAQALTPNMGAIPSNLKEFLLRPDDVESWADRLTPLTSINPGSLKVGICWAGMARDSHPSALAIDLLRSTTLNDMRPLTNIQNITWVSLQKGPPSEQVKNHPPMLIGDFTEEMYDFYETACVMENCDLIITVDTAVAHVAASIGKPTWLLSRWDGCWRWFGDREDSPWYPSLRQFVQPAPHDWAGLMTKVAKELAELVRNKSAPELNLTLAK